MQFFSNRSTQHSTMSTDSNSPIKLTSIGDNIMPNGLFSKPLFNSVAFIKYVNDSLNTDGVLLDELIPIRKAFINFSLQCIETLQAIKSTTNKIIAVWHSFWITKTFAKVYQKTNIDYILLESYWPWKSRFMLWLFFKLNYSKAKKYGFVNKLIISLGVNQNHPKFNLKDPSSWWSSIPWCNYEKTLDKQLSYIKEKCPGIAGIGYFIASISDDFLKTVDAETVKYFF